METATLDLSKPNEARAAGRLEADLIVWLGTIHPAGRPHLVPVWFLWHEGTILIFSKPDQKVRNLTANPAVMLALDDTDTGEQVVLIEGRAELLPPGELSPSLPAYAEKYAAKLTAMGWTPDSMSQEYTQAIRITPHKFRAW